MLIKRRQMPVAYKRGIEEWFETSEEGAIIPNHIKFIQR